MSGRSFVMQIVRKKKKVKRGLFSRRPKEEKKETNKKAKKGLFSRRGKEGLSKAAKLKADLLSAAIDRENYPLDIVDEETGKSYLRATEFKQILKGDLFKVKKSDALDFGVAIHKAIEEYLENGLIMEFMTKSQRNALPGNKEHIIALPKDNEKAIQVFKTFQKIANKLGLSRRCTAIEPAYIVPLKTIELAKTKVSMWARPLLEFFAKHKISIKVNPDMLICKDDGTVEIWDWKTTSKTSVEDIKRDMRSFGQKLSLLYHAAGLEALGFKVTSFNLIYMPKVVINEEGRYVHLQASGPRVEALTEYVTEYIAQFSDEFPRAYERHYKNEQCVFEVL